MTPYSYITSSLIVYPIISLGCAKYLRNRLTAQKRVAFAFSIISILVIAGMLRHIITASQNLNWFLVTLIYLNICLLINLAIIYPNRVVNKIGRLTMLFTFGIGYLMATVGFFVILMASFNLQSSQRKWLTKEFVYAERNIGQGPDPSVSLKKVEVYKTVKWLPILAYRIQEKTYNTWNKPMRRTLDVTYVEITQTVYLASIINNGSKVLTWKDSICLKKN